jgi:hypothetical protein
VTVLHVHERVEGRGLRPEIVADRLNLDIADVYDALADYHRNPEEMQRVKEHRRAVAEDADTLEKPDWGFCSMRTPKTRRSTGSGTRATTSATSIRATGSTRETLTPTSPRSHANTSSSSSPTTTTSGMLSRTRSTMPSSIFRVRFSFMNQFPDEEYHAVLYLPDQALSARDIVDALHGISVHYRHSELRGFLTIGRSWL